jgi:beta-lactamase class A
MNWWKGRRWIAGIALFLVGTAVGFVLRSPLLARGREIEQGRIGVTAWTSPYLEPAGERDADPTLARARVRIERYLDDLKTSDPTIHVSVYARDLFSGSWIGIDEDRPFQPASLMKVFVLFHSLARLDADPMLRGRSFVYAGPDAMPSPDNMYERPISERMVPGTAYRFDELLERMMLYSDNHAKDLLMTDVNPADVEQFMQVVGVPKRVEDGRAAMDPQSYSLLFRILYNSSVFSRLSSEYALDLLSRATYEKGMRSSLPPGIPVASKFGLYFDPNDPESGLQLHECGIVYAPYGSYVLCIMTQSLQRSPQQMAEVLAEVSRLVFEARTG